MWERELATVMFTGAAEDEEEEQEEKNPGLESWLNTMVKEHGWAYTAPTPVRNSATTRRDKSTTSSVSAFFGGPEWWCTVDNI